MGGMWDWAQVLLHMLRNGKLRKPQCFLMGCKQNCPTFAPDVVILIILFILDCK